MNKLRLKAIKPVHANVGQELAYRRQLHRLIDDMHASVVYWTRASLRANRPLLAMDDFSLSVPGLLANLRGLRSQWRRNFNAAAKKLASHFTLAVNQRSATVLQKALRQAGFSVDFTMTPAMRDVLAASIAENVSLIKSIPEQYLNPVEQIVLRSVQMGHNMEYIKTHVEPLIHLEGNKAKNRAVLIAKDQTRKVTAQLTRARQMEVGIEEAKWLHSHAGKVPRPTHVAMDGQTYNIAQGMYDPDPRVSRFIQPGELINCRCVSRALVKGFS